MQKRLMVREATMAAAPVWHITGEFTYRNGEIAESTIENENSATTLEKSQRRNQRTERQITDRN